MKLKLPSENNSRSKKKDYADPTSHTKLYAKDYKKVRQLIRSKGSTESEVLREIVSDWFRIKEIENLGRNQVEDPIRRIYERVVEEKLSPILDTLHDMKKLLARPSQQSETALQPQGVQSQNYPDELLKAITGFRTTLEQTGSDLFESISMQVGQLDELQKTQKVIQSIASETFASSWTVSDLIIRYLVEVNLRENNMDLNAVENEASGERRGLRLEGLKKMADLEEFFSLPEGHRLIKLFHIAGNFPLNLEAQSLPI